VIRALDLTPASPERRSTRSSQPCRPFAQSRQRASLVGALLLREEGAVRVECWLSSIPAATRVWTPVAAPSGEREPAALAGRRGLSRPQAPGDYRSPWPSRRRERRAQTPRLSSSDIPGSAYGADSPAFVCDQVPAIGLPLPRVWRGGGLSRLWVGDLLRWPCGKSGWTGASPPQSSRHRQHQPESVTCERYIHRTGTLRGPVESGAC
jgi:hypothetical protein